MKLINELFQLTSRWQAEGGRSSGPDASSPTEGRAHALRQCALQLHAILLAAERDKDVPLLEQLADIRSALELAPRAGHATVLSRIGHVLAEAADHGEHSDFHNARYQRLRAHLTGILGVSDQAYDAEILDMVRERAQNAWLLTPVEHEPRSDAQHGSFRQGGHSPRNIWLDPDRGERTGEQVMVMFAEEYARELVRSLNLFPGASRMSGPASRENRAILLNGSVIGFGMASRWAHVAVNAMNAHFQSEYIRKTGEPVADESGSDS
jgi:hypothetical protein